MRLLLCLLILVLSSASPGYGADEALQVVRDARQVLQEMLAANKGCAPATLLEQSEAVAIFPAVLKAGLIVGGRYGRGVLLMRGEGFSWKDPLLLELVGGSLGWQAGAASVDLILLFGSADRATRMLDGKLTLNADVGLTAGPVGSEFKLLDQQAIKERIFVYSRTKGVFAGISIEGASLSFDSEANRSYYHLAAVTPQQILAGDLGQRPIAGRRLQVELADYLRRKSACPVPQPKPVAPSPP